MKSLFYRIEEKFISPIKKYPAEFIILLLLLWLPSAYIEAENPWHLLKIMVAGVTLMHNIQFLFNVALAYLATAIIHYIKHLSKPLGIMVFALVETIMLGMFVI